MDEAESSHSNLMPNEWLPRLLINERDWLEVAAVCLVFLGGGEFLLPGGSWGSGGQITGSDGG